MLIQRLLGRLDWWISRRFRLSHSGNVRPGRGHRPAEWVFYTHAGPRFIIFRGGKYVAIGGIFSILHRYDATGRLLSRQLQWKAKRQEGDVVLFAFSKGINTQAIDGKKLEYPGLLVLT
ncbi:MAG: hypothetical protein JWN89_187 [Parcubacteria group bacterium]|nr:hypothetical protein [Parcubacteria group bacterium]